MLPVVWAKSAREDLTEIVDYISGFNPAAAGQFGERIEAAVRPLSEHPYLYPQSRKMPGYREVVVQANYLVFYQVLADRIEIKMVAHGRRRFPIVRK